jgi:hypothetical protein
VDAFDQYLNSNGDTGQAGGDAFDQYLSGQQNASPFTSTVKSTSAGILNSLAGQPVEDIGKLTGSEGLQSFGEGVREYSEGVQKANPSQINSLGDIVDKPGTAIKTALGNLVPQVPLSMAGAYAGAKTGASLPLPANLKPIAGAVGAGVGMFAPSYAQEYTEMRGKQNESGQEDIGKAALAAIPAAGLETAADYIGLGRLVPNGIAGDVLQEGASRLAHVGKQALKGAGAEAATEYAQTGLEQYGGNEDLTTDQAANERNVSAALGGIGGGMMRGGISAFDQRQTNLVPPAQEQPVVPEEPKGPLSRAASQANVAPVVDEQMINPALNPSGQAEQINPTVLQDEQPAEQPIQPAASTDNINPTRTDDAMVSASGQPVEASRIDSTRDNPEDTGKREEYVNNETGRLLDLITQNDKSPSFGNSVLLKLAKLNGVDSSQYADPKVLLSDIASIHAERNKPQTANDVQYVSPIEDNKPTDSSKPDSLENRLHDDTVITKVGNKSLEENEDQFIRRLMRNNRSHTYETAKEAFNKKLAQQQEINDNTARPETESTGTDVRNAITSSNETGNGLSGAENRDTDITANTQGFSQQVNNDEEEKAQENAQTDERANGDIARTTVGAGRGIAQDDAQQGYGQGLDGELGVGTGNGAGGLRGGLSEGERYSTGELYSNTDNTIPELNQPENKNENTTNTNSTESSSQINVNESQPEPRQNGRQLDQQTTKPVQQVNEELAKATESYPQVKALVDGGVTHDSVIMAARDLASGDDGMVKHLAKKHQIKLPEQEPAKPVQAPVEPSEDAPQSVWDKYESDYDAYYGKDKPFEPPKFKSIEQQKAERLAERAKEKEESFKLIPAAVKRGAEYVKSQDDIKSAGQYVDGGYANKKDEVSHNAYVAFKKKAKQKQLKALSDYEKHIRQNNVKEAQQAEETPTTETSAAETGKLKIGDTVTAIDKGGYGGKITGVRNYKGRQYITTEESGKRSFVADKVKLSDAVEKSVEKNKIDFSSEGKGIESLRNLPIDTKESANAYINAFEDFRRQFGTDGGGPGKPKGYKPLSVTTPDVFDKFGKAKEVAGELAWQLPYETARRKYNMLSKAKWESMRREKGLPVDESEQPITSTVDDATPSREEQGSDTGTQVEVAKQYPTEKAAKQAIKRSKDKSIDTHDAVEENGKWIIKSKPEQQEPVQAESKPEDNADIEHNGVRIYRTKIKDTNYYTVEIDENRDRRLSGDRNRGGDGLFQTLDEAKKEADLQVARREEEVKWKAEVAEEEKKSEEAKAKKKIDDYIDGFKDDADPKARGIAVKYLNKPIRSDGKVTTIKELVKSKLANGEKTSTFEEDKIKPMSRMAAFRADERQQREHEKRVKEGGKKTVYLVGNTDLGKIAYDYANYLSAKEPEQQEAKLDNANVKAKTEQVESAEQTNDKTEETASNPSGRDKLNSIFKQLGRNSYKSASAELKSEIENHPDAELIKQVQKHWSDVLLDVGYENKEDSNKPNSKVFIQC